MAKYTTQIRTIIENGYQIFGFDYPIFDEEYRSVLETKIVNRYFFREIGFETVGQFKHFLKTRMNEIMPYYNQHYLANLRFKDFDPYKNKDFYIENTRTSEGENTSSNEGTTTGNSSNTGNTVFNDTPTTKLGNRDYATTITNEDNNSDSLVNASGKSDGNFTSTEDFISHLHGHDGMKYPADILENVRETINNIDVEIIENLSDLFMNVY
jgi:hypothetical protein